jgi:hypothetical protein
VNPERLTSRTDDCKVGAYRYWSIAGNGVLLSSLGDHSDNPPHIHWSRYNPQLHTERSLIDFIRASNLHAPLRTAQHSAEHDRQRTCPSAKNPPQKIPDNSCREKGTRKLVSDERFQVHITGWITRPECVTASNTYRFANVQKKQI